MQNCPECSSSITVNEQAQLNEVINCSECGDELEVIGVNPIELVKAPEIEEDWGE